MPKIVFTADPKLPSDWTHLGYKKGDIVDLAADQCERWINRGVAAYSLAAPPTAAAPPAPPVATPAPGPTAVPQPDATARNETPATPRRFGRQNTPT